MAYRGEVKVQPMTDYPERFKPGTSVYLGEATGVTEARPVRIAASRPHQGQMLVLLADVRDRNSAELLRNLYLLIPEEDAMPLGEHENYLHDLVGLNVQTIEGEALGVLTEILSTPAHDVYILKGPRGEVLIPAIRDVVLRVDLAERKMTVALPEGLLAPAEEKTVDDEEDLDIA